MSWIASQTTTMAIATIQSKLIIIITFCETRLAESSKPHCGHDLEPQADLRLLGSDHHQHDPSYKRQPAQDW